MSAMEVLADAPNSAVATDGGEITLVIAEDHALVREAVEGLLSEQPGIEVLASVGNADDALEAVLRINPKLVLMDVDMPGLHCFEAAGMIRAQAPASKLVFFSAFVNDRYIESAIRVGAWGYISKSEPSHALVAALRQIASGQRYFSPEVKRRLIVDVDGLRLADAAPARLSLLTQRETEILRYLAKGLSKKDIAVTVHLSVNTVARHIANIMGKLDIHDRVALTRFAIREGMVNV